MDSDIQEYRVKCHKKIFYHRKCVEYYSRWNNILNIINIVIPGITAFGNIATFVSKEYNLALNITYMVLLYISSVASGIQTYKKYSGLVENHKTALTRYKNLMVAIEDYIKGSHKSEDYYRLISDQMHEMRTCPDIPMWMIDLKVPDIEDCAILNVEPQVPGDQEDNFNNRMDFEMKRFNLNSYKEPSGSSAST